MNKKTVMGVFLAIALIFSVMTVEALAYGDGKAKGQHENLEERFSGKAHMILKNEDELGLTDKQIKEIKKLKIETKKDLIQKNAEIDIIALDIKAEMYKKQIDADAIDRLIDKKYDLKKEKAKSLVKACVGVKETLTSEQKDKLKDIQKKCKKEMMKKSMMKGNKKCPIRRDKK